MAIRKKRWNDCEQCGKRTKLFTFKRKMVCEECKIEMEQTHPIRSARDIEYAIALRKSYLS